MNTRHKYQYGSLARRKRIRTEDVWEYRHYETTPEGQRCRRSKIIGTRLVLEELTEPYRTIVLVAACLGLRASEIVGLEWGDLNWENLTLLVRRSVVHGRVGETKTEASRLPLLVDPRLADAFKEHRGRSVRRGPSDFVFANRAGKPRWQESLLQRQIKPAALRAGIGKIGWHTFRHYAEFSNMPNDFVETGDEPANPQLTRGCFGYLFGIVGHPSKALEKT